MSGVPGVRGKYQLMIMVMQTPRGAKEIGDTNAGLTWGGALMSGPNVHARSLEGCAPTQDRWERVHAMTWNTGALGTSYRQGDEGLA